MDKDRIRSQLTQYSDRTRVLQSSSGYRKAAVLVLLSECQDDWELVFTRRTDRVHTHKGQVSFPGGMQEPTDASLEATALREAFEEIGLPPASVEILGKLPVLQTVTGFEITPVVGWANSPIQYSLNPDEVEKVFSIPIEWLKNPKNWGERLYTRSNGTQEMVIFYESYEGEVLWGATARMVWHFLEAIHLK